MIKNLVIVGGGGLGRELLHYIRADMVRQPLQQVRVVGVIDPAGVSCEVCKSDSSIPCLGLEATVEPRPEWQAIVALGSVRGRMKVTELLKRKGWLIATYVHPSAIVAEDATIGTGTVIGPYSVVNSGAQVGECCCINVFCSVGHGAILGDFSVLSPYSALNGNSRVGARGFLGTRATVYPNVHIGESCIVDTHAQVKNNVGDRKIVSVRGQYLVLDNRLGV